MTEERYKRIAAYLQERPGLLRLVILLGKIISCVNYLVYPLLLVIIGLGTSPGSSGDTIGQPGELANPVIDIQSLASYIMIPGLAFITVRLLRKIIGKQRPYEALAIKPLVKKDSRGDSFPSCHVFSAFAIAMCCLTVNTTAGIVMLVAAAALAVIRVITGLHYISDVVAGAVLGILLMLPLLV